MKFSRRKLVSAAVSIAFVAGTMASGAAQAVDKIRWAVPMAFGSNLTALGDTMPWVAQLLERKKPKVAAVALANKNARIVWAMMATGEPYREPELAAA